MGRANYTVEQIIVKLREVELQCNQGKTIAEAVRQIGVTEQTYYRWRKEYGGMNTSDAKRMKELEKENVSAPVIKCKKTPIKKCRFMAGGE